MIELLTIAVIVAIAAFYVWKKLSAEASGKESCCEQSSSSGQSCAFKDFIEQEGKPQRLNCSAQDRKKRQVGREAEH